MSLSQEQRQVLDLLAEGKINADEAQKLLERLNGGTAAGGPEAFDPRPAGDREIVPQPSRTGTPKYLRIFVDSKDGDAVNVRVPLALVRTGIRLTTVLPRDARAKIEESGIDLSNLNSLAGEELIEALRELSVDVDSSDGNKVRIFCE